MKIKPQPFKRDVARHRPARLVRPLMSVACPFPNSQSSSFSHLSHLSHLLSVFSHLKLPFNSYSAFSSRTRVGQNTSQPHRTGALDSCALRTLAPTLHDGARSSAMDAPLTVSEDGVATSGSSTRVREGQCLVLRSMLAVPVVVASGPPHL